MLKDGILITVKRQLMYITDKFRTIKRFFRNLIWYWEILKTDEWWDYSFFLELQARKLENMSINWKHSHYVDFEAEQVTIDRALFLTKKLKEDNYLENAMGFMDIKYGALELNEDDSDATSLFLRGGKEPSPEEEEDWLKAFAEANKNKEADKKELFELIATHLEFWWD